MNHDQIAARLRSALEREADRHEFAAGAWPRIESRLVRPSWRRAGIATVCIAIAAAVATAASFVWPAVTSQPVSHPPPGPAPQLVLVSRTHLGPAITKIAAGYGGVWVIGVGVIYRVDPATGRKVTTIAVPGTGDIVGAVATGAGSVWVTSGGAHRGIYRIDPRRDRVTAFIRLRLVPTGITVAYGHAWVTEPSQGPGIVVRIDTRTNRVSGPPIHVGPSPGTVVPAAGALWVASGDLYSSLSRINPVTGAVTPVRANVERVDAAGANSLWVMSVRSGIERVDPETGQVTATIRLPHALGVTFWAGSAWASIEPPGALARIDPASDRIIGKIIPAGATPLYIAGSPNGLWVANSDTGDLLHLAPALGA